MRLKAEIKTFAITIYLIIMICFIIKYINMKEEKDLEVTNEVLLGKKFQKNVWNSSDQIKEESRTRILELLDFGDEYKKLLDEWKYEWLAIHVIWIYFQEKYSEKKVKSPLIPSILEEIYDLAIESRNYDDAVNISSKVLELFQWEWINSKISDWQAKFSKAVSLRNLPK